jgi:hypothetical protein
MTEAVFAQRAGRQLGVEWHGEDAFVKGPVVLPGLGAEFVHKNRRERRGRREELKDSGEGAV